MRTEEIYDSLHSVTEKVISHKMFLCFSFFSVRQQEITIQEAPLLSITIRLFRPKCSTRCYSHQVWDNICLSLHVNCSLLHLMPLLTHLKLLNFESLLQILPWRKKKILWKNKKWNSRKLLPCLSRAPRNNASLIVYNQQPQTKCPPHPPTLPASSYETSLCYVLLE